VNVENFGEFFEKKKKTRIEVYYTVEMELGGQTVELIPDTGSFSLLVTSSNCDSCPHKGWHPEKSDSFEKLEGVQVLT
jgi:hypothetical protein